MKKMIPFSLSALALLLSACQSVYVTAPVPSVDSPEIRPPQRVSIELGIKPMAVVEIAKNAGSRPPDLGQGDVDPGYGTYLDLGFTPNSKLLLKGGLYGPFFPAGFFVKGQLQVMGKTQDESVTGDRSLSLIAETMTESHTSSGDQETIGGAGHKDWKGTGQMSGATLAVSYGYRAASDGLFFIGGGYGVFKTSGKVEQSATDTSPAANYDIPNRSGNTSSIAIGYDHMSGGVSNYVGKIVYYHINHDQFSTGRAAFEVSASFR